MNCGFTEQNADVTFVHYQKVSCKTAVDNKRHLLYIPSTVRHRVQAQPTQSFFMWQSAEPLYESRRQSLYLLQTFRVDNKVRRTGLHNVLKFGPNQRFTNNKHLALEAAPAMDGGEKERSMRTPRS